MASRCWRPPSHREKYLPNRTFQDHLSLLDGIDKIDLVLLRFRTYRRRRGRRVSRQARGAHGGPLSFEVRAGHRYQQRRQRRGVSRHPEPGGCGARRRRDSHRHRARNGAARESRSWVADARRLEEYADFNRDFLAAVREAAKAGKTPEAAAASLTLPERYKAYGMDRAKDNVAAIYREMQ